MSGLKLAALCGFYPHQLGFCGPQEGFVKKALLSYLSGERTLEQKIRKILETFKGAFPYYKLIAKSHGIKDPFEEKVVRAYWIGNELLEKVSVGSLREMVIKEFAGPGLLLKKIAEKKAREIPLTSKAHHSFHVLVIGSVTGRVVLRGQLLDFCRIGWGKVIGKSKIKNQKSKILVEYQPLVVKERLELGKPVQKIVFWEKKFIPEIKMRDKVAIHWNHVVQILSPKDLRNLKKYTQITIDSLNGQMK